METITVELTLNKKKWCLISAYKSPNKVTDAEFQSEMENLIERTTSMFDNILILGDMNYDMTSDQKSKPLRDLMDIFSLKNLISTPTFTSIHGDSLIDVALTPKPASFTNHAIIDIGCSDGHSMIAAVTKLHAPHIAPRTVIYRSYKTLVEKNLRSDMACIPFSVCNVFDDPDDVLWSQNHLINDILSEHVPLKTKKVRGNQPAFMNRVLRNNIMKKTRLHRRFRKFPTPHNWELFRKQRNITTTIRRRSINQYFVERCGEGPKSDNFYATIKPFISSKFKTCNNIMIEDDSNVITEPNKVAEKFNDFFANVAKNIGQDKNLPQSDAFPETKDFVEDSVRYHSNDISIQSIKNDCVNESFNFKHTNVSTVEKIIKSLNVKKATGVDNIPAKILKMSCDIIAPQFVRLFNTCVDTGKFPEDAKLAQVTPIFKKENPLQIKNYRPVSILTTTSKILEKIMELQMSDWLKAVYNDSLAAFRPGYSCQHVLLALCENWREVREQKMIPGLLLVDFSKAFDCLPHSLIVAKLKAYGLEGNSVNLLANYLSSRKQRVKVAGKTSTWTEIMKGVPQGSILGPTIFNIFMNDVFCAIKDGTLYNYADDNSVIVSGKTKDNVIKELQKNARDMINWCQLNQMEANPSKFQVLISEESDNTTIKLNDNCTIESEPYVKLLGVHLDKNFTFDYHISELTRKAGMQLNCLKRIAHSLKDDIKLLLYKSFVLSNFNYCPIVWHHCGVMNSKKLEKIQYRALKFIFNDYSSTYDALLKKAKIPTLEVNRLCVMAIEVYKIYNKLCPSFVTKLLPTKTLRYNLRSGKTFSVCHKRTTKYGLNSFKHFGVTIWNDLPVHIRSATDLNIFKSLIKTWYGPVCKCAACRDS